MNRMISPSQESCTYNPSSPLSLAVAALGLMPQSDAVLITWCEGEEKPLAQVLLAPGEGLSRYHRKLAAAHPVVSCIVRGDRRPTPAPSAFHQPTLRWAIRSADHIKVWSAPFPEACEDVKRCDKAAADAGCRFRTLIETNEEGEAEWLQLIERWRKRSTPIHVFSSVAGCAS
jgi:hypothetical protein